MSDYTRKVLLYQRRIFSVTVEQLLYEIFKFVEKYNNLPTKDYMLIELAQRKDINEEELNHLKDYVNQIENTELMYTNTETTEKF